MGTGRNAHRHRRARKGLLRPCGKNPPSVPCISAKASRFLALSQAPALEFCSTKLPSFPGKGICLTASSLLSAVGPARAETNTQEPRVQLQQTVIRLGLLGFALQTWELHREEEDLQNAPCPAYSLQVSELT